MASPSPSEPQETPVAEYSEEEIFAADVMDDVSQKMAEGCRALEIGPASRVLLEMAIQPILEPHLRALFRLRREHQSLTQGVKRASEILNDPEQFPCAYKELGKAACRSSTIRPDNALPCGWCCIKFDVLAAVSSPPGAPAQGSGK